MKILRPRTFLNLVLIGFVMVSVPLGVGLWTTLNTIENVTSIGLDVVANAVSGTSDSEILSELLRNEERSLRLFTITSEEQYLKQAEDYHSQTGSLLFELMGLPLSEETREHIVEMRNTRSQVEVPMAKALNDPTGEEPMEEVKAAIETFSTQQDQVSKIRTGIKNFVQSQVGGLKQTTADAQNTLVMQTAMFIVATIFLIVVMAFLLSWPVRQLNKSVERLGNGDFKTPINVTGPLDIEAVGMKLDWLRTRLDALEQEKTKFLAHISHELKTPLASIREGAALLNEELIGDLNEKQHDVASILVNNSVLLQDLIENIIDFNMAQAGQKTLDITPVDLKDLIDKTATAQTAKILGKEIKLDLKLDGVIVHGDSKQIEAIFENLFSNAVKYSPIGGTVGCFMRCDKESVACVVFDSGPGVAEDEKDKIFQPFYQVESASHSLVRGSGLGLTIVKEYVKNHRGTITLLNPGDPGARFGITLPLGAAQESNEV